MCKNKTIILHLTDLHFGENLSKSLSIRDFKYNHIAKLITETVKKEYSKCNIIVAIGGDITNKGKEKKYQYAIDFFNVIKQELSDFKIDFVLCPGNHDIESGSENWFSNFNIFSGELTGDDIFLYSKKKTSVLYEKNNWSFIAINSVYHGNHQFGLIELEQLEQNFEAAKYPIVLITHHHFIPLFEKDVSTTRNAYDFLRLCQKYDVKIVLHGHIHSSFKIIMSTKESEFIIVGCGATLPELKTNYNNKFNITKLHDDKTYEISSYSIIYDSSESHKPQVTKLEL